MTVDLSRLMFIAKGGLIPKNGVAGVAGVAATNPLRPKSPELRQLRPLRVKNTEVEKSASVGVAGGVAPLPAKSMEAGAASPNQFPHRCACGEVGVIGVGWFLRRPECARWFCGECYRANGAGFGNDGDLRA